MFEDKFTKENIEHYVDRWVLENFDTEFTFREHQKEAIINVIYNIVNNEKRFYVIEAPTGSGKSLINIISAGVLSQHYNLDSYILCSDLYLFDQYEKFLRKNNKIQNFAYLKGQTGNYHCERNGQDVRNGECRMAGIAWPTLFSSQLSKKKGYECASRCPYVKARRKAVMSKVCVMTYQLYLFIFNNPQFNTDSHGMPIFKNKPVIFCDECHNIPDIVQMKFSISITKEDIGKVCDIYDLLNYKFNNQQSLFGIESLGYPDELVDCVKQINEKFPKRTDLYNYLYDIWKIWNKKTTTKEEDYKAIVDYLNVFSMMNGPATMIEQDISEKKQMEQPFTKKDVEDYKLTSWYHNIHCHWSDFGSAINSTGDEYLLKDGNVDSSDNPTINEDDITISFRCTKEDWMVYTFLLSHADYSCMTSATIGGENAYVENMGFRYEKRDGEDMDVKNCYHIEYIPSTFNFSESPIHFLNRFKMSWKERENSYVMLRQVIYNICNVKFADRKGIIHTGSYEFARRLYNDAPDDIKRRMLIYTGSREKTTIIETHKLCNNTIIVGPTLNEGIDLPGDECRFIIIMKVPYPSLGDKLVKEKIKLFPLWYNSVTSNNIIQGIGRGVRFNGDWCVTYILDACFGNLYNATKDQYTPEFQDRLHII